MENIVRKFYFNSLGFIEKTFMRNPFNNKLK